MRIVGGMFRNRRIATCEGPGYRPVMRKTREAVFSMLEARGMVWDDSRVLDLFAGSGSMGIECLSRGASHALFLEKNGKAVSLINKNLKELGVSRKQASVVKRDLFKILATEPETPFDAVFIDPPYGKNLLFPALESLVKHNWVMPDGFIMTESELAVPLPDESTLSPLTLLTDREYGQTRISIWQHVTHG